MGIGLQPDMTEQTWYVEGVNATEFNEQRRISVVAMSMDGSAVASISRDDVFITNEEPEEETFIAGSVFYDRNANALWDKLDVGRDEAGVVFVIDVSGSTSADFSLEHRLSERFSREKLPPWRRSMIT